MSSWTCWIAGSSVLLAFYDIAKKASVRDNAVLPTLLFSTMAGCAAFAATLAFRGALANAVRPSCEILFLSAVKSVIVASSWVFTFTALRTLPISIATPIRASAPAMVFLMALPIYGETPGRLQGLGMLFSFSGYFAFSWAGRHEGIDFLRNRAVWCAVAGALLSAVSSIWDKYVFQTRRADVDAVQLFFQAGLVAVYGALLAAGRLVPGVKAPRFEWRWTIPFVGILLAGADWMYFNGLSIEGVPVSAASLLRRFSVVIAFVLGAGVFHEKNLLRKAVALGAVLAGSILICL